MTSPVRPPSDPAAARQPLAQRLDGLLFFPVTPFTAAGALNLDAFRTHVRERLTQGAVAVFAACGTGEFWALDPDEYAAVVSVAVEEAAGRVPVVAGAGYNPALARRYSAAAEQAGADALLVLPPYLADGGPAGLRAHYTAIAEQTSLDVVLYQRTGVRFTPELVADLAALPNVVGFKDGTGDLELVQRITGAVAERHGRDALVYLNGMPTAEMSALAYRAAGVPGYSSAVYCFAPDVAMGFNRAYRAGDDELTRRLLDGFYRPLVELRSQGPGYAVSLVKAATARAGLDAGPVRAPLTPAAPEHVDRLLELTAHARTILAEAEAGTGADAKAEVSA